MTSALAAPEGARRVDGDHGTVPPLPLLFRIGKKLRHRLSAIIARSSLVGDRPLFDPADFAWTAGLEARWPEIRAELQGVLARGGAIPPLSEISPDHRRIAPPGKWKSLFLYGYGYPVEENIRSCPKTAEAVRSIPGLNSAFFSILEPGAHIPRHRGVTRFHHQRGEV